jgi:hypothetical protein
VIIFIGATRSLPECAPLLPRKIFLVIPSSSVCFLCLFLGRRLPGAGATVARKSLQNCSGTVL